MNGSYEQASPYLYHYYYAPSLLGEGGFGVGRLN